MLGQKLFAPVRFSSLFIAIAAAAVYLSACGGGGAGGGSLPGGGSGPSASPSSTPTTTPSPFPKKIKHIVIIIQENRSFNNLFYGYPGATTAKFGYISTGRRVALRPVTLATTWDLQHNSRGFIRSCAGVGTIPGTDCRMNGFDRQTWSCGHGSGEPKCPDRYPPYSYVPHDEVQPYFDMAHQYVLADQMYASDFDTSSFISHQYIIAGVNPESSLDYPELQWGCPGGPTDRVYLLGKDRQIPVVPTLIPCWNPKTLGDELDSAGLSWAFYAAPVKSTGGKDCGGGASGDNSNGLTGIWSSYQAIRHICYGPDWSSHVFSPPTRFFADLASGKLAAVSWVTPTYKNSDHGGSGSSTGPSWVTALVNAVGRSKYWDSSAIFIFWDDSGGWYDPEPPAYVDNDGLGFRLPLLIISPYAQQGLVTHVHFEHGSILRFVEDQFGLARLAASDRRANSPEPCCFDFSKPPRAFVPIHAPYDQSYFMAQPLDFEPPDSN